jgi:quercetin dioxygenase-like cupin family protein|tara:strand:- start:804 stop:1202 length:399 start_codon:yes stop_codon:yes gene_type:complete
MENKTQPTRLSGAVEKGWGYELIWATTDDYCGKIMFFNKEDMKTSMHFHKEKDETWFVNSGKFKVRYIDTKDSMLYEKELNEGDVWHNPPLMPHQLVALADESSITEVSTADSVEDNYRIGPGDSQTAKSGQ